MDPDTDFTPSERNLVLLAGLVLFIVVIVTTYTLASHYNVH